MKDSTHKPSKPYNRKIHVNEEEWSWRIAFPHVAMRSPDGTRTIHTDAFELNDTTREVWYGGGDEEDIPQPSVTPGLVKDFLDKVLKG